MSLPSTIADRYIAEFLQMAESANVYFEIISGRLTMRAVNPHWGMWQPLRHLLDQIGASAIEGYLRRANQATAVDPVLTRADLASTSSCSIIVGAAQS